MFIHENLSYVVFLTFYIGRNIQIQCSEEQNSRFTKLQYLPVNPECPNKCIFWDSPFFCNAKNKDIKINQLFVSNLRLKS